MSAEMDVEGLCKRLEAIIFGSPQDTAEIIRATRTALRSLTAERDHFAQLWTDATTSIDRWDDKCTALTAEVSRLGAEVGRLREALRKIENPIAAMRVELQEGERLDGMAAASLAKDAEYLRSIARAALTHGEQP